MSSCISTYTRGWQGYTCPPKVTCFVSMLSWPRPAIVGQHLPYKLPGRPSVTWVTLYSVQSGCLVFVFQVHVPLAYRVSVRGSHLHLNTPGRRYLQSGHCEPGILMGSVMCLDASLGAASVFLCPQIATSLSVWCLRFRVFSPHVHFSLSSSVCPGRLPPHPLYSLGVCRAQPAPGTGSFLTP